jgi:thioredoxin 1
MAEIQNVTDSTFQTVVLGSDKPTIVDFWAAWCGPCKMVAPEIQKLADKYDGVVNVVKVDVDANPELSQAFGIQSIPMIAYFQKGIAPQGVQGYQAAETIESKFGLKALV